MATINMTNADEPIFPQLDWGNQGIKVEGLTKREFFAALNNASILGRYYELPPETKMKQLQDWIAAFGDEDIKIVDAIAKDALRSADAFIAQINKK